MVFPFDTAIYSQFAPLVRAILIPVIVFLILNFLLILTKKGLLKKAKTRKQTTNVYLFIKLAKYLMIIVIIWIAIFSYTAAWTGLGLSVGFFAVLIAWTFMRPLLGIIAWLTLVIKRPFVIGDRVKIGDIKGDVEDITLTHIYINETGGLVHGSEDTAGSFVIVPNAVLFEQNIINYTHDDNYVLQEVSFTVTFDSNLDNASKVALEVAKKVLKKEIPEYDKKPFIRTFFHINGVGVHVRFFAPAKELGTFTSNMTYEILKGLKKVKGVKLCSSAPAEG